jgi:hypothetical protein
MTKTGLQKMQSRFGLSVIASRFRSQLRSLLAGLFGPA